MRYYLFIYLLRYLFWFFIFLRQVFIFRAVLLLTLCQCAALRCYISWVCIIIKPSLYILKSVSTSLSRVHVTNSLCLFPPNTVCKLYSIIIPQCEGIWKEENLELCSFLANLWICLNMGTAILQGVYRSLQNLKLPLKL